MKWLIIRLPLLLLLVFVSFEEVSAQMWNTDPALAVAVKVAGDAEKKALDGIKSEQSRIRNLQTAVTVQLKKIEEVQKKTYEYLSNVSVAVQNAHDIKKCAELSLAIGDICKGVIDAVKQNPQGLITTAVATKQMGAITKEVAATYAYIAGIALNKKTLLDAAERLQITWRVRTQLQNIYNRLYSLMYNIQYYKFRHLPQLLSPDAYYNLVSRKQIAESVIRDFSR
ncbi:hypothetical protein [uncultured Porphyromonas sp.]|uniref:hypothetical protein n=1 Tax=uncultured Porphyromonas sp. TaxID=159274 RepID=UPI00258D7136|nr:hypothetical protein [uncultured Porphyromonas sp.]